MNVNENVNVYFIYNLNDSWIISNGNVFIKNKCIDTNMYILYTIYMTVSF